VPEPWNSTPILAPTVSLGGHGIFLGSFVFSCGTQTNYFQRVKYSDHGRPRRRILFNAPNDRPNAYYDCRRKWPLYGGKDRAEEIPVLHQSRLRRRFLTRIREDSEVPVPLEDALATMKSLTRFSVPHQRCGKA